MDNKDLPDLTEKQMNFVLGIQKGLSKSDAYRKAYDCTKMNHKHTCRELSTRGKVLGGIRIRDFK